MQLQGHRQARLVQLQSQHNSSLLFKAKLPGPQLEMHFSKSAALVQVAQEFFMALIGLKRILLSQQHLRHELLENTVKSHVSHVF